MSRPGITYSDVASVAELLQAKGQNPTIENIRTLTGTGSSTTIANHLKAWKIKQEKVKDLCDKEQLPEEIVICMNSLWERVMHQSDIKIEQVEQSASISIQECKREQSQLQEKITHLEHQHAALQQEKNDLSHTNMALNQHTRVLEDEKIKSSSLIASLERQLEERLGYIQQLKTHGEQAQANLEHFREATRISTMQERDRFQQVQQQAELALQQAKQEQLKNQQYIQVMQSQNEQLNLAHAAAKSQLDNLIVEKEEWAHRLKQTEIASMKHYEAEQHWQSQFQLAQEKCDNQTISLMALQPEIAVLNHELLIAKEKLVRKRAQIETLAHEKWVLSEEKSQLLAQFKKLEARM